MSEETGRDLIPVLDEEKQELEPPKKYKVVLLNDDFTPMDFVVQILVKVFAKAPDQATKIMFDVHKKGKGIAGVYTHDIAETKAQMVSQTARAHDHPLKADLEAE